MQSETKVRCPGCGKKNTDPLADRCRICGTILPNANLRRSANLRAATDGPAFTELVESEVNAWREYAESRGRPGRSRRLDEEGSGAKRVALATGHLVMILIALAVGAGLVYGAWVALIA